MGPEGHMRPGQGDGARQGAGKLQQAQLGVGRGAGHRGLVVSGKGLREAGGVDRPPRGQRGSGSSVGGEPRARRVR